MPEELNFYNEATGQRITVPVRDDGLIDVAEAIKDLSPAMQKYFLAVKKKMDESKEAEDG